MSSLGKSINRIQSAPPDEGEPDLKISYNPNAIEFLMPALQQKSSQQKKGLNAEATDYVPSSVPIPMKTGKIYSPFITQPARTSIPINNNPIQLKSFAFNPSVSEFSPLDFKINDEPNKESHQVKALNSQEKKLEAVNSEKNTEEAASIEKSQDLIIREAPNKEEQSPNPPTENTKKDENIEGTTTKDPDFSLTATDALPTPNSSVPEEPSNPSIPPIEEANKLQQASPNPPKKRVYDLETIKTLKFTFNKDPNFLILPVSILTIKDREVEETKSAKQNRRGQDDRRISKEFTRKVVVWRKAKTAEEQKISDKAKEYQRKFTATVAEIEKIKKEVKSTLNKLSPNNLEKLTSVILDTCKKSHDSLKLVVSGIFEKAWSEKKYTQMYSDMCKKLKDQFENYRYAEVDEKKLPKTRNYFKYELLYMCEETFHKSHQEEDFANLTQEQKTERLGKLKDKTLGNVRFIGELFNVNLITTKTVLGCVIGLLDLFEAENNQDRLEGACLLLLTGGASFERSKLLEETNMIYDRLDRISQMDISSKNKFKIMDLKEYRQAGWNKGRGEGLKKVEEIHADFKMEQEEIKRRHGINN